MPGLDGLEPLNREPIAATVANQLRAAIIKGVLRAGTPMVEGDLVNRLGVSRGPLREAMQRLVQEGLLRAEPHRGLFVVMLDAIDAGDVDVARTAVERAACQLILRSDPTASADRLAEAHRRMERAARGSDESALTDAHLEFHELLVAESGSERLRRIARTLLAETRMYMSTPEYVPTPTPELLNEHRAIVDAIRAKDETELLRLIDIHMHDAVTRLIAV